MPLPATAFARVLRGKDNEAEAALWLELRDRRLHGYKFNRELPVGRYFADFACRRKRLIVELDGSQHAGSEHDVVRDTWLNAHGWSVLRFSSTWMLEDREAVLETIVAVLENRLYEKTDQTVWRFWPASRKIKP